MSGNDFDTVRAAEALHEYAETYLNNPDLERHQDVKFINEMLYGLAGALDKGYGTDQYHEAEGFQRFKDHMQDYAYVGFAICWPQDDFKTKVDEIRKARERFQEKIVIASAIIGLSVLVGVITALNNA